MLKSNTWVSQNGEIKKWIYEPESFKMSNATELVNLLSRLDPAALGWIAAMSPDRPIPWINLQNTDGGHRTMFHNVRLMWCGVNTPTLDFAMCLLFGEKHTVTAILKHEVAVQLDTNHLLVLLSVVLMTAFLCMVLSCLQHTCVKLVFTGLWPISCFLWSCVCWALGQIHTWKLISGNQSHLYGQTTLIIIHSRLYCLKKKLL